MISILRTTASNLVLSFLRTNVTPAKAGAESMLKVKWIPAFAGMTSTATFAWLLLATGASPLHAQQPARAVTLDEARRLALNVNPAAVATRSASQVAEWERRYSRLSLFTPTVTATTGFTRFSEPFFNFGTGEITPNATSATLEARYTVLEPGRLSGRRRAQASVATADANEVAARAHVTLVTDAAYYTVLTEVELARIAADRLTRAREQLVVARVRVQAGDVLATDSLQLLLEVSRAQIEVLRRDSALTVARLQLGSHIGLSGAADAAPLATAPAQQLPISLDAATAEMLQSGPAILALRAEERRADAALSAERERYLPDVSLGATIGRYDSRFFPSALHRSQFSLMVSLPIWDAGRRELEIARARAQTYVADAARVASERATGEQMAQAYRGYQSAIAQIQFASEGVAVATENFRVQSARYREGAGMILDMLQAQVDLGDSEATLVRARYSARLAQARIEALLGRQIFN